MNPIKVGHEMAFIFMVVVVTVICVPSIVTPLADRSRTAGDAFEFYIPLSTFSSEETLHLSVSGNPEWMNVETENLLEQFTDFTSSRKSVKHPNEEILYSADNGFGLRVFDITNPSNPLQIFSIPFSKSEFLVIDGIHLFVACRRDGFRIFDISTPTNPILVHRYSNSALDFYSPFVDGQYLYFGETVTGFLIFDISTISSPTYVSTFGGKGWDVVVEGTYAYVASLDNGGRFEIWDVSDVTNPVMLSYVMSRQGLAKRIVKNENFCFVAEGPGGLTLIDVSDKNTPVVTSYLPGSEIGDVVDLHFDADHVFVGSIWTNFGFYDVDVSDKNTPRVISRWQRFSRNICVHKNTVYLADGSNDMVTGTFGSLKISGVVPLGQENCEVFEIKVTAKDVTGSSSESFLFESCPVDYVPMECFGVSSDDVPLVCSGRGDCVAVDTCVCDTLSDYEGNYTVSSDYDFDYNDNDDDDDNDDDNDEKRNRGKKMRKRKRKRKRKGGKTNTNNNGTTNTTEIIIYFGKACEVTICGKYFSNDSRVCSGHGTCIDYNVCECDDAWKGGYCKRRRKECFGKLENDEFVCSGHGKCKKMRRKWKNKKKNKGWETSSSSSSTSAENYIDRDVIIHEYMGRNRTFCLCENGYGGMTCGDDISDGTYVLSSVLCLIILLVFF